MKKIILALAMIAGSLVAPCPAIVAPGFAQAPAPVPAEPDAERRTRYTGVSSVTTFAVGFDIYGDGTDFTSWVEVWVNGINQIGNWSLVPTAGSFTTLARPLLAANLNVVFTASQSGTIDIVGARRPRRTSQLSENQGVPARAFNQIITDLWMTLRENWDKTNDLTGRAILGVPGDNFATLPPAATRANGVLCFNGSGAPIVCAGSITGTTVSAPMIPVVQAVSISAALALLGGNNASNITTGTLALAQLPAGIDANNPNLQSTNYSIATTDCQKTIVMSGGQHTATLPAVAGFDTKCVVAVYNANASAGVILSGFPTSLLFPVLYPGQFLQVRIVNGAWIVSIKPGRWQKTGATFLVDTGGSDTLNDGISLPFATLDRCFTAIHVALDLANATPTCQLTGGQTFTACTTLGSGAPVGYNLINLATSGTAATLKVCGGGGSPLVLGDGAILLIFNITFDCTGGAAGCAGLFLHQANTIVDFQDSNSKFIGAAGTNFGVQCDQGARLNINSGITYQGTFQTFLKLGPSCSVAHSGVMAMGTSVAADLVQMATKADFTFSSSTTFNGTPTIARQGAITGNSVLVNASGAALPGTAAAFTGTGGQSCTGAC